MYRENRRFLVVSLLLFAILLLSIVMFRQAEASGQEPPDMCGDANPDQICERITTLESAEPEAGPAGPAGMQGPAGPAGEQGLAGQNATADGVALAMAMSSIPHGDLLNYSGGLGLGSYDGETAVAVGLNLRIGDNAFLRATSGRSGGKNGWSLGASWGW